MLAKDSSLAPASACRARRATFKRPVGSIRSGATSFAASSAGKWCAEQPGLRDGPDASQNAAAIFAAPDWSQSPFLTADAGSRLYCCGCSVVVVSGLKATHMPNAVWTCAGHPPLPGGAGSAAQHDHAGGPGLRRRLGQWSSPANHQTRRHHLDRRHGYARFPANISLGGDWPTVTIWTPEHQQSPITLDFTKVAGACVQMKDETLKTF